MNIHKFYYTSIVIISLIFIIFFGYILSNIHFIKSVENTIDKSKIINKSINDNNEYSSMNENVHDSDSNIHVQMNTYVENLSVSKEFNTQINEKESPEYLLVICTSLTDSLNVPLSLKKQKLLLYSWTLMQSSIKFVVFTHSQQYMTLCEELGIEIRSDMNTTEFGSPLLSNMISLLQDTYIAEYYGYVSPDIIISTDVADVLNYITINRKSKNFYNQVFISGKSYNFGESSLTKTINTSKNIYSILHKSTKYGAQYLSIDCDYFFFSFSVFKIISNLNIAMNQNFVFSVLIDYIYNQQEIDIIDISDSIQVVHISHDINKDVYGSSMKYFNYNKIQYNTTIHHNSIRFANYFIYKHGDNLYTYSAYRVYDDYYSSEEIEFLKQYINKTKNVLSYNKAYSIGKLGTISSFTRTMNCDRFYWREAKHLSEFKNSQNNNFNINYRLYNQPDTCYYYYDYIRSPFNGHLIRQFKRMTYNIITIDGACPLHIIKFTYNKTRDNILYILRGLNLYSKHYIKKTLDHDLVLIEEYIPNESSNNPLSISVYKKNPNKTDIFQSIPLFSI